MSRYVRPATPENVDVYLELAGIGTRFVAAAIDHAIQIVLIIVITIVVGSAIGGAASLMPKSVHTLSAVAVMILMVVYFLVMFGYHTAFELLWSGQTPGKRAMGLRVMRDGGFPIDVFSSIARNLVRIVDFMPVLYAVGLVSIFFHDEYKRLGDMAAGTIVIKDRPPLQLGASGQGVASPMVAHYRDAIPNVDCVAQDEFVALRRFVERRHELEIPVQAYIGMRLTIPLLQRMHLNLSVPVQWQYADIAEAIVRRYVEERGLLSG